MATEAWRKEHQEELRKYRRDHYHRNAEYYKAQTSEYRAEHKTKVCNTCGLDKAAGESRTKVQNGRTYLRYECNVCDNERTKQKHKDKGRSPGYKDRVNGKRKADRKDPTQRPRWIVEDCLKSDKKHNRECDIDQEFVRDLISHGCQYCGSQVDQMTLDRIDNDLGHMKANVNPACFRCNLIRGSMPYEAWTTVVPGVKTAFETGQFGEWSTKPLNSKPLAR